MATDAKKEWDAYRTNELTRVRTRLTKLGYSLSPNQVHVSGERFLMSGKKLVLVGTRLSDTKRVIIKASSDANGAKEIESEHQLRVTLPHLPFAYQSFPAPEELLFEKHDGLTVAITGFIPEEKRFLEYPLRKQFVLALKELKAQEATHTVAYGHDRIIRHIFEKADAKSYLADFSSFAHDIDTNTPKNASLQETIKNAATFLINHVKTIEQYCGFLTHTDFVPHNLRVTQEQVYLLDHTSFRFGNKYESWARFLNYMLLYNQPLEQTLVEYVRENRTPEEYLSLRLMRAFKLGQLLAYYARSLTRTTGDLHTLTQARLDFWAEVLDAILVDEPVSPETIENYKTRRDALRSEEEKARQREFAQV
ncbi:MAG: hypothetical protein B7X04_00535 [Parcubacteria group bacterium 21-54-25]|nr:MAG: hypothetical protein B7X04_00535 [Parcubacteria group bacterium 21-54-25]HQU07459.1 hypothetical protein [Candidatus Paceibacterota bacterium]